MTEPPKPIQLSDVRHVLRCVNPNRALGADQWHFRELAALPDQFLERLAKFYNMVEKEGQWPPPLRQTLVALIPKDGAKTELELRPIGLTPIIYRLWMCIRKNITQDWTRNLYGPRCLSATDLAWETRTMQELVRSKGQRAGSIFLDCSKCYERVPHTVAYADAIRTGPHLDPSAPKRLLQSTRMALGAKSPSPAGRLMGCILLTTHKRT